MKINLLTMFDSYLIFPMFLVMIVCSIETFLLIIKFNLKKII
jgi:hypothetical protein